MKVITAVKAAGDTHPGLQRQVNEDRFHYDVARGLFIVVDGVGGQAAGGKAADVAVQMLRTRLERFPHSEFFDFHASAQSLSFDKLCGDEICLRDSSYLVNGKNVGMIKSRSGARFLLEAPQAILVSCKLSGKKLERYFAM